MTQRSLQTWSDLLCPIWQLLAAGGPGDLTCAMSKVRRPCNRYTGVWGSSLGHSTRKVSSIILGIEYTFKWKYFGSIGLNILLKWISPISFSFNWRMPFPVATLTPEGNKSFSSLSFCVVKREKKTLFPPKFNLLKVKF